MDARPQEGRLALQVWTGLPTFRDCFFLLVYLANHLSCGVSKTQPLLIGQSKLLADKGWALIGYRDTERGICGVRKRRAGLFRSSFEFGLKYEHKSGQVFFCTFYCIQNGYLK